MRDLTTDKKAKETLRDKIYQEENEFENKSEEVRVLVRERDRDFFQEYILEDEGTSGYPSSKKITEPQKKMIKAVQVFRKKLLYDNKIDIKFLNEMIKYVLNNCILVYVKTTNLTSAFRLFSILNDRGMPLTASDLLKSINLGAINKDVNRVHYQKLWEEIEEDLERAELDKLIGFIRTIFIKEKAKKSIVDEFNELIYDKKILNRGADFVKYLVGISQIYQARILNAELEIDNKEIEVKYHNLITLMRDYISASDWMPVFLSFVDKFEDKYKIYSFLRLLEKKFVVNWIRGVTPTERTVEMNRLLHIIEEAVFDDDVLNNQIFNTEEHHQEILKELNRNDFYSKKYSKYLLMRLNMDLSENSSIKKMYESATINIEHILPQNPKENSEWMALFNDREREKYTNRIGNLVLLSRKKNSLANNKIFSKKIVEYYSKGITDFELTKEIKKYKKWTTEEIEERQEKMIDTLIKIYI